MFIESKVTIFKRLVFYGRTPSGHSLGMNLFFSRKSFVKCLGHRFRRLRSSGTADALELGASMREPRA
jgi:hypothetical protein